MLKHFYAPIVFLFCCFFSINQAAAQTAERISTPKNATFTQPLTSIQTDYNYTAQELVEDIFLSNDCNGVSVSNIQTIGDALSIGHFTNGTDAIDINEGIILSTGNITNAHGPNIQNNAGNNLLNGGTDVDLEELTSANVNDASGIEFDFVPTTDLVTFEYVFASEEYCEYVGSIYNDVFGLFISGPGINGGFSNGSENIAVIPNTINANFVAINTVNHTSSVPYFVSNRDNCGNLPAVATNDIEYDGFTVVLTAMATVVPCETYHIKLVVGDSGDSAFDSAVMLKAGSFESTAGALGAAVDATEGCSEGAFTFTREGGNINEPLLIDINLSPTSTATPGLDYQALPASITIPAGETTYTLPLVTMPDAILEGTETVALELAFPCGCDAMGDMQLIELMVEDVTELEATSSGATTCPNEPTTISVTPSGGLAPYSYLWGEGQTTQSINVNASFTSNYNVTITDDCGQEFITSSMVEVLTLPTAILSGSGSMCPEENIDVPLQVTFTGNGPWELNYTQDGLIQSPITTNDNPYTLVVNTIGNYELASVSYANGACEGSVSGIALVEPSVLPTAILSGSGSLCPDESSTVALQVDFTGNGPWEVTYMQNGVQQTPITTSENPYTLEVNSIGDYELAYVAYTGGLCEGTASGVAQVTETVLDIALETTSILCHGDRDGEIIVQMQGGTMPYTYTWNTPELTDNHPTDLAAGNYNVTVTDANACVAMANTIVTENPALEVEIATEQPLCQGDKGTLTFTSVSGGEADYVYSLNAGEAFVTFNEFSSLNPGEYNVMVQDINGCMWEDKAVIEAPIPVIVDLVPEVELSLGDRYQMLPQLNFSEFDAQNISWSNSETLDCEDCLNPFATPLETTTYNLTLSNEVGCRGTAEITLKVDKSPAIFVPNAFSPNDDGVNDILMIYAKDGQVRQINSFQVFDRWGEIVATFNDFMPNDPSINWNGMLRGKEMKPAVYIWFAEVELIDNQKVILKGDVSLIR